jgi:hypothetical protein
MSEQQPDLRAFIENVHKAARALDEAFRGVAKTLSGLDGWMARATLAVEARSAQLMGAKPCPGDAVGSTHDFWIGHGYACPACKAAL